MGEWIGVRGMNTQITVDDGIGLYGPFPHVEDDQEPPVVGYCTCEFHPDYNEADGYPSWHFKRTCLHCGFVWAGLHCRHDGYQNPCPQCGVRPTPVPVR